MQTVVTILNVIASLASLATVWFGWVMAGFAAKFTPQLQTTTASRTASWSWQRS